MKTLRFETDARGIATLTLARPEKRNALSSEMIAELADVAAIIATDGEIRAVVLDAEGSVFCAGGDLEWMRMQMAADVETRRREATTLANMLKALNDLPVPLIARVQGDAFGGGLGVMAISDAVIAVETARFGLTETRLGLIPATIGPYVLAKLGAGPARRIFTSPRIFAASEAVSLGIASRVVPSDALDQAVEDEVTPYLTAAPGAVSEGKALLRRLSKPVDAKAIEASIDALVTRWSSAEAEEGTRAFFEKRPPNWVKPASPRPSGR